MKTFVINYHNNIMDAIEVEKTREDKDWICECFQDCFRGIKSLCSGCLNFGVFYQNNYY